MYLLSTRTLRAALSSNGRIVKFVIPQSDFYFDAVGEPLRAARSAQNLYGAPARVRVHVREPPGALSSRRWGAVQLAGLGRSAADK